MFRPAINDARWWIDGANSLQLMSEWMVFVVILVLPLLDFPRVVLQKIRVVRSPVKFMGAILLK